MRAAWHAACPSARQGMMIGGMASGCPLHNLVPEWNDLVYTGNWEQAYTAPEENTAAFRNLLPRVCPALCEAACTCNLNGEPVATKENERAIIENAYEQGWAEATAARKSAQEKRWQSSEAVLRDWRLHEQLNRRGHQVTVFERSDRIGGLLTLRHSEHEAGEIRY